MKVFISDTAAKFQAIDEAVSFSLECDECRIGARRYGCLECEKIRRAYLWYLDMRNRPADHGFNWTDTLGKMDHYPIDR